MNKSEIVTTVALPADEQSAEPVVPRVGSFDDPTTWFAFDASEQRMLSTPSDVGFDLTNSNFGLGIRVVVPFVQAEMLGPARSSRSAKDHRVQGLTHHPLVMYVGAGDGDGQRNTLSVDQDMPLHPEFAAVCRVSARMIPPFGDLTIAPSKDAHFQSTPCSSS